MTGTRRVAFGGLLLALAPTAPGQQGDPTPAPRVARALEQVDAPLVSTRQQALRALEAAGAAMVPAAVARLRRLTADAPCREVWGEPGYLPDSDEFYDNLDAISLHWPEPGPIALDLLSAADMREQRGDLRRAYAAADDVGSTAARLLFALSTAEAAASPAVPLLVRLLGHPRLASDAGQVLVDIGPAAVPAVVAALGDRHRGYAAAEVLAVLHVGRPPSVVPAALVGVLQTGARRGREAALLALGRIGRADEAALAAIADEVRRGGRSLRAALWALARAGRPAVPIMRELLREDRGRQERAFMLAAVRLFGDDARGLAADVLALAAEGVAGELLADALAASGPGSEVEARAYDEVRRLEQGEALVGRAAAVFALGAFRRQAGRSALLLASLCRDEDYPLQRLALEALQRLGPAAAAASSAVRDLVGRAQPLVDRGTLATMQRFSSLDLETIDDDVVAEWDSGLRCIGVRTLGAIDRTALPLLLELLADDDLGWAAVDGLVALGEPAVAGCADLLADGLRGDGAAAALGRLGDAGIDSLLRRLGDADPEVADRVEQSLQYGAAAGVEDLLVRLLRAGSERQRDAAARVLAERDLSALRRRDADSLLAAAQSAPLIRRRDLVRALETVDTDRVVRFLCNAATDADVELRRRAVSGLATWQDVDRDDVGKTLRRALEDEVPSVRMAAAAGIGASSGDDLRAVPSLLAMAASDLAEERATAMTALGAFRSALESILPVLRRALDDRSDAVVCGALRGIAGLGPLAGPAADDAVACLRGARGERKYAALAALQALRPDLTQACDLLREPVDPGGAFSSGSWSASVGEPVEDLLGALRSAQVARMVQALTAAGREGGQARELLPVIEPLLHHADVEVRCAAVEALWKIRGIEALAALRRALADESSRVRSRVLQLLRAADRGQAAAALGVVLSACDDSEHQVVALAAAAAGALATVDGALQPQVELALLPLMDREAAAVRAAAAAQLGTFAALRPETTARLVAGLDDADATVARAMATGLRGAGPAAIAAVPRLLAFTLAGSPAAAAAGLGALQRIAPTDPAVLWAALEALQRHGRRHDAVRVQAALVLQQ